MSWRRSAGGNSDSRARAGRRLGRRPTVAQTLDGDQQPAAGAGWKLQAVDILLCQVRKEGEIDLVRLEEPGVLAQPVLLEPSRQLHLYSLCPAAVGMDSGHS